MPTLRPFAVLLVAAAVVGAQKIEDVLKTAGPVPADQQEKLKEFKKFCTDSDVRVRADQNERLSMVDHAEAAKLLVEVGMKDDAYRSYERAVWALSRHKSEGSVAVARIALRSGTDEVRGGCALALSKMTPKPPGAAAEVAALLAAGGREGLKVALCQALGFFGDKAGTAALVANLKGPESIVVAASDALALVRDEAAVEALIGNLKGGTWRTQVAAIDALELIRDKRAIAPLIDYLTNAEGKPREDAKNALQRISGRTFGMNPADWVSWWKDNEATFKVPTEAELAKVEAKEKEVNDAYGRKHKVVEYHRIKTYSKRLLFVIDVSASMSHIIKVKRGYDAVDQKFQASPKIDLARHELKSVLKTLDKDTWFNVVAFETEIRPWKKEPVQASATTIAEAVQWVERQKPLDGTQERSSLPRDSNGWILGRTNTYGALKYVFGRPLKPGAGVTGNPRPAGNSDTVFFLTDGEPTEGETTNLDEILADVAQWNKTAKLTIHTIGMSESTGLRTLLDGIARQTGGKCVFVGE